jgi:RNA-directed DNA polymerase
MRDLEFRLGAKRAELRQLLDARPMLYRSFLIPKKQHPYPGEKRKQKALQGIKYREIDNPVTQLKDIQKRILRRILSEADLPEYMFGAVAGRTLGAHAQVHVANQSSTLVKMDISSYYPNVTCVHVYFVWNVILGCPPPVAKLLTELTTYEWRLPQGAPTSPMLANILLASIYAPICLESADVGLTISTWVDDLIFSGLRAREIMELVRSTLAKHGFKVAPGKREILGSRAEKVVTGVRVGRDGVRVSHKKMSEIRAAIHRLAIKQVEPSGLRRYKQNLSARIAHLSQIHAGDAAKLRELALRRRVRLSSPPQATTG